MKNLEVDMRIMFLSYYHARLLMLIELKNASSYTCSIPNDYYEVKSTLDALKTLKSSLTKKQIKNARNRLYARKNPIILTFHDNTTIRLSYAKFNG